MTVCLRRDHHFFVSSWSIVNHGPTPEDEKPLAASLADSETGKPGSNVILKCSNCDQKVLITCVKRTKSIDAELLARLHRVDTRLI
jgi:hypothetical protein